MLLRLSKKIADQGRRRVGDYLDRASPRDTHNGVELNNQQVNDLRVAFDAAYYLERNDDVQQSGVDPFEHFMTQGWKEGRDPRADFSMRSYLQNNSHVEGKGLNPFVHWILHADKSKVSKFPHHSQVRGTIARFFDKTFYLDARPDVRAAGVDPLDHYIHSGWKEGVQPNHWFDPHFFIERFPNAFGNDLPPIYLCSIENPDFHLEWWRHTYVDANWYRNRYKIKTTSDQELVDHYFTVGWKLGYDPSPFFSTSEYLENYGGNLAPGQCPLEHYISNEHDPHIQPSDNFAPAYYLSRYPEVKEFGHAALYHFMRWGRAEGRQPRPHRLWADPYFDEQKLVSDIREAFGARKTTREPPEVSVIIPVYNNIKYTMRCVWSIAAANDPVRLQIIIADDCSSDETQAFFSSLNGITYIRNRKNLGFLKSCNNAAAKAKAPFIFLLNNDTAVLPGWISSSLNTFSNHRNAGLVGSKLLYPNGMLQEAGGVIWNDGSGANVGRWNDPDKPEWNFIRDTNYISGAAVLLRKDLWDALGGFDIRYAPAYCEDSDLALQIKAAGFRVLYQPASRVVHFEGVSSGTDLSSGIKAYQVVNTEKLKQKWEYALSFHPPSEYVNRTNICSTTRPRLLFIDAITPEPDRDAGSVTAFYQIQSLINVGYDVTFIPANLQHSGRYTADLQEIGVECLSTPYVKDIYAYLRENASEFDVFFINRVEPCGPYARDIRALAPETPIIFHTQDLHYLRMERGAALTDDEALREAAYHTKQLEHQLMALCDATIVVSKAEKKELENESFSPKVHVVPLVYPDRQIPPKKNFDERDGVVFVGGYRHGPNVDAVTYFVEEVWPLVMEQCPDLKFYIVGSRAPKEVQELAGENIVFQGFVEDLDGFYDQMRVSVAPLRFGAGVKGKIGSALRAGLPVVASEIAAEGMGVDEQSGVLVEKSPMDMAEAIIRAHEDPDLWTELSDAGEAFVEREYSIQTMQQRLSNLLFKIGAVPFKQKDCPFAGNDQQLQFSNGDTFKTLDDDATTADRLLARWALAKIGDAANQDIITFKSTAFQEIVGTESPFHLPKFRLFGELELLESNLGPLVNTEPIDESKSCYGLVLIDCTSIDSAKTLESLDIWEWLNDETVDEAAIALIGVGDELLVELRTAVFKSITSAGWACTADCVAAPEYAFVDCVLYQAKRE